MININAIFSNTKTPAIFVVVDSENLADVTFKLIPIIVTMGAVFIMVVVGLVIGIRRCTAKSDLVDMNHTYARGKFLLFYQGLLSKCHG